MRSILGKLLKRKTAAPKQFDALYVQAISAAATQDFQRAIELYDRASSAGPTMPMRTAIVALYSKVAA